MCEFLKYLLEKMWLCLLRDASCGPSTYSLMLVDCLRGVHKVCYYSMNLLDWSFNSF